MTTCRIAERKNDMFIKVKVVEGERGNTITDTKEKYINTDYIVIAEPLSRSSRFKYEDKYVDVSKIKLITGENIEVIGELCLQDGHIHIKEE